MSALVELSPAEAVAELNRTLFAKPRTSHMDLAKFGVEAASKAGGLAGWRPETEDRWAEEYQSKIYDVQSRAVNLHTSNADIRGHNLSRTARCVAAGIEFKALPNADEIQVTEADRLELSKRLNRLRAVHSRSGGFDASGRGRSEGILQYVTFFTHLIMGGCLIHRVWKPERNRLLPLALELIPGSRISTPYTRMGDPLVHWGIEYSDEYRSEVVGYHVKRVPRTIGNAAVQLPEWDFIPKEDAQFLELLEPAGFDRALPNCVAVTRLVFNRGQMFESAVEASRAHAEIYAVMKVAGLNPYDAAQQASDGTNSGGNVVAPGFHVVDGVKMLFAGEKDSVDFRNVVTPGPDFVGVDGKYDERICRGLGGRLSEFTRRMDASYSGGMQERQNDVPQVQVLRENFLDSWRTVHGWYLDACYLASDIPMPGYNAASKPYWLEARTMAPAEVPLNPVDHRNAQKLALAMGLANPQMLSEADGHDYERILDGQALAWKMRRAAEKLHELPEGVLEPLEKLPEIKTQPIENPDDRNNDGDRGTRGTFKASSRTSGRMKAVRL